MNSGEVVILSTAVSAAVSFCMVKWSTRKPRNAKGRFVSKRRKAHADDIAKPNYQAAEQELEILEPEELADTNYSVTGTPARKPWNIRKREIEAQHKTKRKARDEYREMN